jgi:hypothetical protein
MEIKRVLPALPVCAWSACDTDARAAEKVTHTFMTRLPVWMKKSMLPASKNPGRSFC